MNAEAYLRKQGWQGSGHSLDSTGRGIKKPLLISHKQDQLGLGKKKAAHTTDDQWWMRAFDASLQSIGSGKESTLSQIRTQGINRGGLYGFFVRGEQIEGTIDDPSATTTDASAPQSGTNTPPTSASTSDTEAPAPKQISDKKNKRKRAEAEADAPSISEKKSKRVKSKKEKAKTNAGGNEHDAVAAKLAKLKPAEKAEYEARAAAKKQTIEQYVLRRIQKKTAKQTTEPVEAEPEPATKNPLLFFTDLGGDPNLANDAPDTKQQVQPAKGTIQVQDRKAIVNKGKDIIHEDLRQQKQEKKAARRQEKAAKKASRKGEKEPSKPETAEKDQDQNPTNKRIAQSVPVDHPTKGTQLETAFVQDILPSTPASPTDKPEKQKKSKAQKADEKKAKSEKKAAKKKNKGETSS